MTTIDRNVAAAVDDAQENGDGAWLADGDTWYLQQNTRTDPSSQYYYAFGAKFNNITIPQGATIDVAYISLYVDGFDDPEMNIYLNDVDNPDDFDTTKDIIHDRARTNEYASWSASGVAAVAAYVNSPSITDVVKEVIDRPGWESGNSLAFLFIPHTASDNIQLACRNYRCGAGLWPLLHIEYTEGITGTACWGHETDVVETNIRTFTGNWTGTGAISGDTDAETIDLNAGEYMISEVVNTGIKTVELDQNHYAAGDDVNMDYRHGATHVACEAAEWNDYSVPFISLGYVQVRLTSTL